MNNNARTLVLGACRQIGTELTVALRDMYGAANVIVSGRYVKYPAIPNYLQLDVMDGREVICGYQ